jgi:DNA polymerase III epsilon subunit-like protein
MGLVPNPPLVPMTRIAVIDFETIGMSPAEGDRPTKVAIVMTEQKAM